MRDIKRIFLIVLDSFGVGELPDADRFGDKGAFTLKSCYEKGELNVPVMKSMGLFNIDGMDFGDKTDLPVAAYAKMREISAGKDTTIGHWEISGVVSENPLPVYPEGFPEEFILELSRQTGRKIICNKTYSGTQVIHDYGREHIETGALIVYTSADSVCQIAAHEDIVPVEDLYRYCEIARKIFPVGRIIARPFEGEYPDFRRTSNRHDFSLKPASATILDALSENNFDTIAVGKINDIFAGCGITEFVRTSGNDDGMIKTDEFSKKDFTGLCFTNLVDFDMLYGHRRDSKGYAQALNKFDKWLSSFIRGMKKNDLLIITADHGCDPSFRGTDHTREYVPLIVYGDMVKPCNLGVRDSFSDIAAFIAENFGVSYETQGVSFADKIIR